MRKSKLIFILIFCFVLICSPMFITASDMTVKTVTWTPPPNFTEDNDCDILGDPLTQEDIENLVYVLKWRVVGGEWNYVPEITQATEAQLSLPWDSQIELEVGAKQPGGEALCFSLTITQTPIKPPPGSCKNVSL